MDQLDGYDDDHSIPSISEIMKNYPMSFDERISKTRYAINVCGKYGEDYCILVHSNNLCALSLAPTHPLITDGHATSIRKIDFRTSVGTIVRKGSTLCKVYYTDGDKFKILSPIPGKLVEMNGRLLETPNIVYTDFGDVGLIATILLQKPKFQNIIDGLVSADRYFEYVKNADDDYF